MSDIIETTYALGTIDNPKITCVRNLSKDEYDRHVRSIIKLTKQSMEQQLYSIVELNYQDFNKQLQEYVKDDFVLALDHPEAMEKVFLNLNRLLLNYLAAVKTFLDHTETRLSRRYGEESEEFKLFKSEIKNVFDNHFEYKFLYYLRNYAQHCGVPSGAVHTNSKGDENGNTVNTLSLLFDRDNLLSSFKDWRHAKKELSEMDEYFDVMPIVERQHDLLDNINDILVAKELLHIKEEGEELLDLMIEANNSETGIPQLIEITESAGISTYSFPYRIIGMITNVKMDINYTIKP